MPSVNEGQSSDSTLSSTPESVKREADELAKDLLGIIDRSAEPGSFPLGKGNRMIKVDVVALMQALSIYIVTRDHQILQHGIGLGKKDLQRTV